MRNYIFVKETISKILLLVIENGSCEINQKFARAS